MENPTIRGLEYYHNEMVVGFAALIAKNMRRQKKYKNIIDQDYLNNLSKAAPMRDFDKTGVPDAFLMDKSRWKKYITITFENDGSIPIEFQNGR